MARVELENGEWCRSDSDGIAKHGQHYKGYGSCGYVNWHLIDKLMASLFREMMKRK